MAQVIRWHLAGVIKLRSTHWTRHVSIFRTCSRLDFDLGASGSLFEIAARHWSNAYIKESNIGENFLTLGFSY